MVFNGETFEKRPKDVRQAILALKPAQLHTDIFVTLKKGNDVRERHLSLSQGKKLFNNEDFLDVFVLNLMLN
jgi:hypothetical protein